MTFREKSIHISKIDSNYLASGFFNFNSSNFSQSSNSNIFKTRKKSILTKRNLIRKPSIFRDIHKSEFIPRESDSEASEVHQNENIYEEADHDNPAGILINLYTGLGDDESEESSSCINITEEDA